MTNLDLTAYRLTVLGSAGENAPEQIRCAGENCKGHEEINDRVWYRDMHGEHGPGKQVLAVRRDRLDEVLGALGESTKAVPQ